MGALRPSSRISKLRCESLWKMFELLMQWVHCCRDSQQRVALCVLLEDCWVAADAAGVRVIRISELRCESSWKTFELLRMQRVCGSHCGRDSHQRAALCCFLKDG